jgi:hypothetical protein
MATARTTPGSGRPVGESSAIRKQPPHSRNDSHVYLRACDMLCVIRITTPGSIRLVYHAKGVIT